MFVSTESGPKKTDVTCERVRVCEEEITLSLPHSLSALLFVCVVVVSVWVVYVVVSICVCVCAVVCLCHCCLCCCC